MPEGNKYVEGPPNVRCKTGSGWARCPRKLYSHAESLGEPILIAKVPILQGRGRGPMQEFDLYLLYGRSLVSGKPDNRLFRLVTRITP